MTTEAQKRAMAKYAKTAKGIAARRRAQRRYNARPKGKAARRNYLKSAKGKEAVARSRRRAQLLTAPINRGSTTTR